MPGIGIGIGVWKQVNSDYHSWGGVTYLVLSLDGVYLRWGVRDGYDVEDITLTALGFDGVENTDWENVSAIIYVSSGWWDTHLLPDSAIWIDFTDSPVTLNGAKISQVNDLSGNGINFSQATDSKRPSIATDISGKKYCAIRVGGALLLQAIANIPQPFTIFFTYRANTFVDYYTLFSFRSGADFVCQRDHVHSADSSQGMTICNGTGFESAPEALNVLNKIITHGYVVNGLTSQGLVNNDILLFLRTPGTDGIVNPGIGHIDGWYPGNFDLFNIIIYPEVLSDVKIRHVLKYNQNRFNTYELSAAYGFGDSIANGGSLNVESFYIPVVKTYGDILISYASGGCRLYQSTNNLIDQYNNESSHLDKSKKVFVHIGSNDMIVDGVLGAVWNTSYRGLVAQMISDGFTPANIYLTTPPYFSTRALLLAECKGYLDQMATDYGVHSVDLYTPMLAGGGDALLGDNVHPTQAGADIMSATLIAAL